MTTDKGAQWFRSTARFTSRQKAANVAIPAVHSLLARQVGIVSVSDVEVIRQEHF